MSTALAACDDVVLRVLVDNASDGLSPPLAGNLKQNEPSAAAGHHHHGVTHETELALHYARAMKA